MSAQPESRSARHQLTRGWLAALAATSPAALSHGLADGHAVAPLPLAVALVLAACVPAAALVCVRGPGLAQGLRVRSSAAMPYRA